MGKNGYLERQRKLVDVYRQAEKDTYIQYMLDTAILTLTDPDAMGKDTFGQKRIERFVKVWGQVFDTYHAAIEKGPEADYFQNQVDKKLESVVSKEHFSPFEERYEWIKKQNY